MKKRWNELIKYVPLLRELVIRDLKVQYRRSILGILWTVLTPLFTMTVMTLLFSRLFKNDIQNFAVYYFTGYILYSFCNESTMEALRSIVNNQNLIKKNIYTTIFISSIQDSIFFNESFLFIYSYDYCHDIYWSRLLFYDGVINYSSIFVSCVLFRAWNDFMYNVCFLS